MTPDELAKSGSEHAHQRALFAWLNMAARYGFFIADSDNAYKIRGWADEQAASRLGSPRPSLAFAFAIHNQGHGDRIRGARARAEGVKAGAPDLMLPICRIRSDLVSGFWHGLFIEMKKVSMRPKRGGMGGVKDVQIDFHKFLTEQGYKVAVCYGWREAADTIKEYLS